MIECEPLFIKKDKEYVKTPLYGKCKVECGCTILLFDGKCFCSSFGTVEFKNEGACEVEIYVNKLPNPVSLIPPGGCFNLASTPLNRIVVKCSKVCECTKCKEICNYSTSKGWSNCNYNKYNCNKCVLCYKGWVCSKIPDVDCPEMCCD